MMELQLASLELCAVCRAVATLSVRVDNGAPLSLRGAHASDAGHSLSAAKTRVPPLRARGVKLWLRASILAENQEMELLRGMERLEVMSESALDAVAWPSELKQLVVNVSSRCEQPLRLAKLPACLEQLSLRGSFDENIDEVEWPITLQQLTLGGLFDQSVDKVEWPDSLLRLSFGGCFTRSLVGVVWPVALQQLTLGDRFDQPLVEIRWPASLRQLTFGYRFDQVIVGVAWPASLQRLLFGYRFNQAIAGVVWPSSLRRLEFGVCFNQPVDAVVWPACLEHLTFGHFFNQSIVGSRWPPSLRNLELAGNRPPLVAGMKWPAPLTRPVIGRRPGSSSPRAQSTTPDTPSGGVAKGHGLSCGLSATRLAQPRRSAFLRSHGPRTVGAHLTATSKKTSEAV